MMSVRPVLEALDRVDFRLDQADRVLIAIDCDSVPGMQGPSQELRRTLSDLAGSEHYSVAIVSSLAPNELASAVRLRAIYIGHDGFEIAGSMSFVHPRAQAIREAIYRATCDVVASLQAVDDVAVTVRDYGATIRLGTPDGTARDLVRARLERIVAAHPLVRMCPGPDSLELRPRVRWNRAAAVRHVLSNLGASAPALVFAGRDALHEGLFSVLRWEISIDVQPARGTRARFFVHDTVELVALLRHFADSLRPEPVVTTASAGAVVPAF